MYAVPGIVIFGSYTLVDFNRLRRADMASSRPIAASIFLDIFDIFLLVLQLFGSERNWIRRPATCGSEDDCRRHA